MRHDKKLKILGVLLMGLISCDYDGYHFLGTFPVRVAAENKALEYLYDEYDNLPEREFEKVLYGYHRINETVRTAIWYNKTSRQLGIEKGFKEGCSCIWHNVSKPVLKQLMLDEKGVFNIKYLSHPNPNTCQYGL